MLCNTRSNAWSKRLLLALTTILFGAAAYIGMVTAATPTSFTFEAQMGAINNNNPAMMQTVQELQREHQELQREHQDLQYTHQNGSPNP